MINTIEDFYNEEHIYFLNILYIEYIYFTLHIALIWN